MVISFPLDYPIILAIHTFWSRTKKLNDVDGTSQFMKKESIAEENI